MEVRISKGGLQLGTWNHRVIRHMDGTETTLLIHEVHYDSKGRARQWTKDGAQACGENLRELAETIARMRRALKRPICIVKEVRGKERLFDEDTGKPASNSTVKELPAKKRGQLLALRQLVTSTVQGSSRPSKARVRSTRGR